MCFIRTKMTSKQEVSLVCVLLNWTEPNWTELRIFAPLITPVNLLSLLIFLSLTCFLEPVISKCRQTLKSWTNPRPCSSPWFYRLLKLFQEIANPPSMFSLFYRIYMQSDNRIRLLLHKKTSGHYVQKFFMHRQTSAYRSCNRAYPMTPNVTA